jgi:transcriptional regulator with XRE-family HTH domain
VKTAKKAAAVRAGNRIRAAREERGWTLAELAVRTGGVLAPNRISNYEQGLREPDIATAELLATALHVPAAWLLGVIDPIDRELLTADPAVRANVARMIQATYQAARETPEPYIVRPPTADD